MKIGVSGTREFNDYNIFLRAMRVALSGFEEGDTEFVVYAAGPATVNSFVTEFTNITENSLKARGIKTKVLRVTNDEFKKNIADIDFYAFLCTPGEDKNGLVRHAEDHDVEVRIFRF
jgi:hypothetical protein